MKVAILQSNYIPWKGYFDIIRSVDKFIFYDDVQYTTRDWRNRNLIKTKGGLKWLTIPCGNSRKRLICEVEIKNHEWQKDHWNLICINYRNSPFWREYKDFFEYFYLSRKWKNLSDLNQYLIKRICSMLDINTEFDDSRKYNCSLKKEERILELLKKVNATEYVSGSAAKNYIKEENFKKENIKLIWFNYGNYKKYVQLHDGFKDNVSIIDLLFNCGKKSKDFI